MTSPHDVDRPEAVLDVIERYRRSTRLTNALVSVLLFSLLLLAYLRSFLWAVIVAILLIIVVRAPIFRWHSTTRLRTEKDPETVVDAFTGPTSPILAFQWGIADEVTVEDGTLKYLETYLFGLRSHEIVAETQVDTTLGGKYHVEVNSRLNGRPWATYTATIRRKGEQTVLDIDTDLKRRFGLRRLLQQLLVKPYHTAVLTVQGYTVIDYEANIRLWSRR